MDNPSNSNRKMSNYTQVCINLSKSHKQVVSRFLPANQNEYSHKFIRKYE